MFNYYRAKTKKKKKKLGAQIWAKQAEIESKIILSFSPGWFIIFPLNCMGW